MFGSLGLFRQLSALGRAPHGSAADLAKRVARLPKDEQLKFKALRAEQRAKIDAARAAAQAEYDSFLEKFGLPKRADYKKERKVVASFVEGIKASDAGVSTDGVSLTVSGREVATRGPTENALKVCPGAFGTDKASRRAANAVLDILGAGVRVDDRGEHAYLRAKHGGSGRVWADDCYTVEVSKKIRERASKARANLLDAAEEAALRYSGGAFADESYPIVTAPGRGSAMEGAPHRRRRHSRRR